MIQKVSKVTLFQDIQKNLQCLVEELSKLQYMNLFQQDMLMNTIIKK